VALRTFRPSLLLLAIASKVVASGHNTTTSPLVPAYGLLRFSAIDAVQQALLSPE
jgi:hypothetical protein